MKPSKKHPSKPLSSPRYFQSTHKALCSSPSFEDSERSTLPSVIHSGFSTARQLLSSPRAKQFVSEELPPLKKELQSLDALQSILLQWQFVNAYAERTEAVFTQKIEEEIYDRGVQVADLQEDVLQGVSQLRDREQSNLLAHVLDMEVDALETADSEIMKSAEYLQQVQVASKAALNRVSLQGDSASLLDSLRTAEHSLERMFSFVADESPDTVALADPSKHLADVIEEEREEVINSYVLLTELRKLYEHEKDEIALAAQDESI